MSDHPHTSLEDFREEFMEIFNVALVVGGSIVIPHLRRAADRMDEALQASAK